MQFLEEVTVLDLTQVWAGPLATMNLGDLGAEIIKIERPQGGDIVRAVPPFVDDMSGYFATVNRNKQSVTLNLKSDDGLAIFMDLAEDADIVVENLKPGTVEKFGVDYESIRDVNPEVVYCSIKGFAAGTQYETHPAYDIVIQAMGGSMSITGEKGGDPLPSKVPVGDISAGMYATQSILAALFAREFGDAGGEYIEIPMMNTMTAFLGSRATSSLMEGEPYPRIGSEHTDYVPYKCFQTRDSYIVIASGSERDWHHYCQAIGREDLLDDERFNPLESRLENKGELYEILDPLMAERGTDEWLEVFQQYNVPCGPVYNTLEIWEDEYASDQELLEDLGNQGVDGSIPVVRYPANFQNEDSRAETGPPRLGAHTEEVLRSQGYTDDEIKAFESEGIIEL